MNIGGDFGKGLPINKVVTEDFGSELFKFSLFKISRWNSVCFYSKVEHFHCSFVYDMVR